MKRVVGSITHSDDENKRKGDVSLNACTAAAQHNSDPAIEYRILSFVVGKLRCVRDDLVDEAVSLSFDKCNLELSLRLCKQFDIYHNIMDFGFNWMSPILKSFDFEIQIQGSLTNLRELNLKEEVF